MFMPKVWNHEMGRGFEPRLGAISQIVKNIKRYLLPNQKPFLAMSKHFSVYLQKCWKYEINWISNQESRKPHRGFNSFNHPQCCFRLTRRARSSRWLRSRSSARSSRSSSWWRASQRRQATPSRDKRIFRGIIQKLKPSCCLSKVAWV